MGCLTEMVKFYSRYEDINTLVDLIQQSLQQLSKSYSKEKYLYFQGTLCNKPSSITIYRQYIELKIGDFKFYFDRYEYDELTKTLFLYSKRELIGELKC